MRERIVGVIHESRLMCRWNCAVQKAPPPSRVSIVEISLCGCYIETMFTMAVGEKALLILWLNEQSIRTTAVVATRHPQVGNGFEFIDLLPEDRLRLGEFIHEVSSETHNPKL